MILGLTTATRRCTVALVADDGSLVAERGYDDEKNHAERMFGELDELLAEAQCDKARITHVACDVGPGSFTGVRVGLAAAKGIALGLGVPLLGVGSLESMCAAALSLVPSTDLGCAVIDAKRGELFFAAYDREGNVRMAPRHARRGEVAGQIVAALGDAERVFCGHAASEEDLTPLHVHPACDFPSAAWIARVAATRTPTTDLDALEPVYVRAPDAKPMRPA